MCHYSCGPFLSDGGLCLYHCNYDPTRIARVDVSCQSREYESIRCIQRPTVVHKVSVIGSTSKDNYTLKFYSAFACRKRDAKALAPCTHVQCGGAPRLPVGSFGRPKSPAANPSPRPTTKFVFPEGRFSFFTFHSPLFTCSRTRESDPEKGSISRPLQTVESSH